MNKLSKTLAVKLLSIFIALSFATATSANGDVPLQKDEKGVIKKVCQTVKLCQKGG